MPPELEIGFPMLNEWLLSLWPVMPLRVPICIVLYETQVFSPEPCLFPRSGPGRYRVGSIRSLHSRRLWLTQVPGCVTDTVTIAVLLVVSVFPKV